MTRIERQLPGNLASAPGYLGVGSGDLSVLMYMSTHTVRLTNRSVSTGITTPEINIRL